MIQIYTGASGAGHAAILDEMYRERKRVFVDLLRWEVPVVDGQFEIDQFDTPDAVYLVSATDDGEHLGSTRLLPTHLPHLLGSIFPQLCDGPVPAGRDTLEITRGCLSPKLRAAERLRVRNRLMTASVHYALLRGVSRFTCVADSGWLSQILQLGWDCRPLGEPQLIERVVTGALEIMLSGKTIGHLRAAGAYAPDEFKMARTSRLLAA